MREEDLSEYYKKLHIKPVNSIEELKNHVRHCYQLKPEKYNEVIESLHGKSEEEQKNFLYKIFIEKSYEVEKNRISYRANEEIRKKYRGLSVSERQVESEIEQRIQEQSAILDECYQKLIASKENASDLQDKEIPESATGFTVIRNENEQEEPEVEKDLKRTSLSLYTTDTKPEMVEFLDRQRELGQIDTNKKYLPSLLTLFQMQESNKRRYDPRNRYRKFTGAPYRWAVTLKQPQSVGDLSDRCLFNEENDMDEREIVTELGEFHFDIFSHAPSREHRAGLYGQHGYATIFGITKLDKNNRILSSEVDFGSLYNMNADNREFVKNRYFSKEWIQNAHERNHGYLGTVMSDKENPSQYMISCNELCDDKLMTALIWAENTRDIPECGYGKNLNELKKVLNERQLQCVNRLLDPYKKAGSSVGIVSGGEELEWREK